MNRRPLLYVAGPYTRPDPVINTHKTIKVATAIYLHTDWVPVVPHLTLLWHMVDPHPLRHWYELDEQYLLHCQAITRLPGDSTGADQEMAVAAEHLMKVVEFSSLPLMVRIEWEVNA